MNEVNEVNENGMSDKIHQGFSGIRHVLRAVDCRLNM